MNKIERNLTQQRKDDNAPDSISYNCLITAGVGIGTNTFTYNPNGLTLAYYTDSMQTPIISNPSEYTLTISSFDIPLQNQAIKFITLPNPLTPSILNSTLYYITLSYGIYTFSYNLLWFPEDLTNAQNFNALYRIQHFIDIINLGFYAAYVGLDALVFAGTATHLPSAYAPYYIYDSSNYTISLITDFLNYNSALLSNILIYFNADLYDIFFNLPGVYVNNSNASVLNYFILVQNLGSNLYDQTGTNITLYYALQPLPPVKLDTIVCIMKQEYSTLWNLNTMENILISTTLPVITDRQAPPILNPTSNSQNLSNNGNFIPLLTDFKIGQAVSEIFPSSRQRVNFANQNTLENRNIPLQGQSPISQISLQVYTQDRYGNNKELYLNNGSSISIKLTFNKKKNVY
jgi:hypothetical protein